MSQKLCDCNQYRISHRDAGTDRDGRKKTSENYTIGLVHADAACGKGYTPCTLLLDLLDQTLALLFGFYNQSVVQSVNQFLIQEA